MSGEHYPNSQSNRLARMSVPSCCSNNSGTEDQISHYMPMDMDYTDSAHRAESNVSRSQEKLNTAKQDQLGWLAYER